MAKILVIGKTFPLINRSSGDYRLGQILQVLAGSHQVDFLPIQHVIREKTTGEVFHPPWGAPVQEDRYEFLDEHYKKLLEQRGILALEPARSPGKPLVRSHAVLDIREFLTEPYDLVWIEFYSVAEPLLSTIRALQPQAKVVIDSVDLHWRRHEMEAWEAERAGRLPLFTQEEIAREKWRELEAYRQADAVVAVSEADQKALSLAVPAGKNFLLPNLFPVQPTPASFAERDKLIFVGNFDHHPNVTALEFLMQRLAPLLHERAPQLRLLVVGNNSERWKAGAPANVEVLGHVPAVRKELERARISLAPIFVGAGMNGKIGEAMAAGVPVITTSFAAENMGAEAGTHCLVAHDARSFCERVLSLWQDEAAWNGIRSHAVKWMEDRYSTKAVGAQLLKDVAALLPERPRAKIAAAKPLRKPLFAVKKRAPSLRFPNPAKKPLLSVVLLAHGRWEYTELCLRSLAAAHPRSLEVEYLLVDNASPDQTRKAAEKIPGLRLITSDKNLGFAGGVNLGLHAAKGENFVLLNNDTLVAPGWLESLLAHRNKIPGLGLLGALSNTERGQCPLQLDHTSYSGREEFLEFALSLRDKQAGHWRRVEKVSALAMLIPRAVWNAVGDFDLDYGLGYFEDDDYCFRVQDAGFRLACAEDVYVHHFGSASFAALPGGRDAYLERGMRHFVFKWGKRALDHVAAAHDATLLRPSGFQRGQTKGTSSPANENILRYQ